MAILFKVENVGFAYQGPRGEETSALHQLSFQIEEGEFLAIIGANGSGKTTLARLLGSLLVPTAGTVTVAGIDTRNKSAWNELHQIVGMVFQNPEDQIITTIVEEDVAFGLENMGLPAPEIRQRVKDALEEVNLWDDRKRPPNLLSAGQLQRLALAGVIAMRPRCVIFDEATTMLDPVGRRVALDAMRRLHDMGVTVIFITHFMDEAVQADRILLLQNGRILMDGTPDLVFQDERQVSEAKVELPFAGEIARGIRQAIPDFPTGIYTASALIQAVFKRWQARRQTSTERLAGISGEDLYASKSDCLVEVEKLRHVYLKGTPLEKLALDDISLRVGAGETHGLAGITGSGKSTLLQHLNGLLRPQSGTVRIGPFNLSDPKIAMRTVVQMAGLVFQNPEMQFFEQFVGDEIAYGPRQMGMRDGLSERVRWAMEIVGLDFLVFKDRLIFTLSGGERRKVALASTLALKPSLLLLDEPTAGLDPFTRKDLLAKLQSMQSGGMTIILSSHQMEVLSTMSQNVTIMSEGKNVLSGSPVAIFSRPDLALLSGLEPPALFEVGNSLRRQGVPLSLNIHDNDSLIEGIQKQLV